MGWIWNILLSCSSEEFWPDDADGPEETCEPLEQINQWIPDDEFVDLTPPTYADGAGYGMDAWLFGGGFRRFDIDGFIRVVEAQNWKDRPNLQLWVKGGEEGPGDHAFAQIELRARQSSEPKRKPKGSAPSGRKALAKGRRRKMAAPRPRRG
jgi:hypothetical protein